MYIYAAYLIVLSNARTVTINSQEVDETLSGKDGMYTIMPSLPKARSGLEDDESKNDWIVYGLHK